MTTKKNNLKTKEAKTTTKRKWIAAAAAETKQQH